MDQNLTNIRHARSVKDFPGLKLEDGEYVEFAYTRAKICLFLIWLSVGFSLIVVLLSLLFFINSQAIDEMGYNFVSVIFFALFATIIISGLIATMIFRNNKLYITNRRVIQYVMKSPVVTSRNFIDLFSIEDVSFRQNSILQQIFNFGTIRLATVGEETTYTFPQAVDPGDDIGTITRLIRDAKASRAAEIAKK